MKKFLLIAVIASSVGCSTITYDALQYDRFITLQEQIEQIKPYCGQPEMAYKVKKLKEQTDHMQRYAVHRINAPEVARSTTAIADMVGELSAQYKTEDGASSAYCQIKLDNIYAGVNTIISGLGAQ